MTAPREFPLRGVAGLISDGPGQLDEATRLGLSTVEVRADLLFAAGLSEPALMDLVGEARRRGLACLFTLRHHTHDGRFDGEEAERERICRAALSAGAQVLDLEGDSPAGRTLLAEGAPVILSHHDFGGMLSASELEGLTGDMEARGPMAVKIVPTGQSIGDAARMLDWVQQARSGGPLRIGFTMGAEGACSRILAIAYGSPITYAAFGEAVAPGQLPIREMVDIYRVHELDRETRVFGIAGNAALGSLSPFLHNPQFQARGVNAAYVPFQTDRLADILDNLDTLRIDGLSVTNPFKGDALACADQSDERSRGCGASNTLVITRDEGKRHIAAFNTDFDGVTIPIAQHRHLSGLPVAVIGNGGAARGAVGALKEVGAEVVLFYRNPAKGQPVAEDLGVAGRELSTIDAAQAVYINATTLGSRAGDPSPVPAAVFSGAEQVAFDMCYQQPSTAFLDDAAAGGARLIKGGEMLVAQGIMQFEHFTGHRPGLDEFSRHFQAAKDYR